MTEQKEPAAYLVYDCPTASDLERVLNQAEVGGYKIVSFQTLKDLTRVTLVNRGALMRQMVMDAVMSAQAQMSQGGLSLPEDEEEEANPNMPRLILPGGDY